MNRNPLIHRSETANDRRQMYWLAFGIGCVVLLAFALGVCWNISLPGLYMDAVNPDYLVIRTLHHERFPLPIWIPPGNLFFDRFPVITSLYHGTGHVWFALPFYLLFGIGIVQLRIAQALFGAVILLGVFAILRRTPARGRIPLLLAGLITLALALDPVFIFAFRTQLYITLAATAWLLAAVLAGNAALRPRDDKHAGWLILLAGIFYGLSVFGYFIYAFFAPALVLALIVRSRQIGLARSRLGVVSLLSSLALGLAIGSIGYLIGYGRIAEAQGGIGGLLHYITSQQDSLGAFKSSFTWGQTAEYFRVLVTNVFSNAWQHSLMFGEGWPEPASVAKLFVLLALPAVLWLVLEISRTPSGWLRLVFALIASFVLVAFGLGSRLSGHHFAVLLPLCYLALGLGLIGLSARANRRALGLVAGVLLIGLGTINVVGQWSTQQQLVATGGRKLFSDAINRFATEAVVERRDQFVVLPDWGLFMPFQFLTKGQVEHMTDIDTARMRGELCKGRDVAVALINNDIDARFASLAGDLGWVSPAKQVYRDREGNMVFVVGTFASATSDCDEPLPLATPAG